ncbi:YceI family protein [Wenyingzhuangia sp. chi5]|uniref:YceI family protein n=1 Tax=Wenyingzhuangia gilva TaxID=3057677 RepID=A0ABT8VPH5_9FLAO|nr:YceI family protein [Wenyingzhuangia sp. chi5]MDO3693852.1 YceI family protein [Wenyingzhuangia sp. chi5]
MKKTFFYLSVLLSTTFFYAQESIYKTDKAIITFDAAKNNIEPISAKNNQAKIIINTKTGEVASVMSMTDFEFPNKLMQEHFNENYIESDKYPKATFVGVIENFAATDFSSEKTLKVVGTFKIHGVSKKKNIDLKIIKTKEYYTFKSEFKLQLEDFKIKIPSVVFYKIAEEVNVSLVADLNKP